MNKLNAPSADDGQRLGRPKGRRRFEKMPASLQNRRIMLVEDDYFIAADLQEQLISHGVEVIGPTGDLECALELLGGEERIDAGVIDINLQGEMAFHLVDEFIKRDIPVVFATGYDAGVVPYRLRHIPRLEKPTGMDEVVRTLAELLPERRARPAP
ncbi:response regulator [Novosphingobium lindaniclasticum]|nr:response regulator [Novosphingobium lindaniclasticum]